MTHPGASRGTIHIGLCGMQMRRAAYFERFSVTEVQQTFYHPPGLTTLARWRAEAPVGFEFTMKAWQLITHTAHSPTYRRLRKPIEAAKASRYGRFQLTEEVIEAWRATRDAAEALAARIIVFQCPPSFSPSAQNVRNLRAFFRYIRPESAGLVLGWEPRGAWESDLVRDLVGELGLVYIVDPFRAPPMLEAPLRYYRLHGRTKYADQYTDDELRQLAGWCAGGAGQQTYVMFNNIPMLVDSQRFRHLMQGGGGG